MGRIEDLKKILEETVACGASDVHFEPGEPPSLRFRGSLVPMKAYAPWMEEDMTETFQEIEGLSMERFSREPQIDFSFSLELSPSPGGERKKVRWRGHTGLSLGQRTVHLRLLQEHPPLPQELGLPPKLVERVKNSFGGLYLITGITGSGKSTTMAALVRYLAETRSLHIVSAEEPVEFLHPRRYEKTGTLVTQVQIPTDCPTFAEAMRGFLRKDPDVIVVGELRDADTVSMALQAAATGHTVIGTLHTRDTVSAIERVISLFPPKESIAIRSQFANALQAIFAQNLIARGEESKTEEEIYRKGRILAGELLFSNSIIAQNLFQDKVQNVRNILVENPDMFTMDQNLGMLVRSGCISLEEGLLHCQNRETFQSIVRSFN